MKILLLLPLVLVGSFLFAEPPTLGPPVPGHPDWVSLTPAFAARVLESPTGEVVAIRVEPVAWLDDKAEFDRFRNGLSDSDYQAIVSRIDRFIPIGKRVRDWTQARMVVFSRFTDIEERRKAIVIRSVTPAQAPENESVFAFDIYPLRHIKAVVACHLVTDGSEHPGFICKAGEEVYYLPRSQYVRCSQEKPCRLHAAGPQLLD